MAQVVAPEVRDACALERGDPDAAAPVVSAEVTALAVREQKLLRVGAAAGKVELDELACDRHEELRLTAPLRLGGRDLLAGDRPLHAQTLAWLAPVVEDVAPDERVGLGRTEALVGEDADEGSVLRVELLADRLDCFGRPGVDRLGARVRDAVHADDGVPAEPAPLDCAVEDALQDAERPVDRRSAGAVDAQACGVEVDRLAVNLAQALAPEVGDYPLVEQRRVGRKRVRAQVRGRVGVPPLDEEFLERGVRADHLGGELAELAGATDRGLEELGVASAVEGALAPGAVAAALVPANDVDGAPVASPTPLDAHLAATVAGRRRRRARRGLGPA
ncbi:MAG TPA: hypothetical protein VH297_04145 [Gaiellaceae bacterium]